MRWHLFLHVMLRVLTCAPVLQFMNKFKGTVDGWPVKLGNSPSSGGGGGGSGGGGGGFPPYLHGRCQLPCLVRSVCTVHGSAHY